MPAYFAPIRDQLFVLTRLAGLSEIAALPGCGEAEPDLVAAVLEEAGRFASEVLAPLNPVGDRQGSKRLEDNSVRTPAGWREAYAQFRDGGWNGLAASPDHGGQGLPFVVSTAVNEIWHAANMAFALCPMLNLGAIEALEAHGSAELKAAYLDRMVAGDWTGTMCLTEPGAGSDLSVLRTRAVRDGDSYRISGQKIFITYGEHDLTDNIVHLVLARLPDAPPGSRGISLFLVPKILPDGSRNDVHCVSLEHKLGIHASPTAVLSFGDHGGAVGWLVGQENHGLACMFTMMNNARLAVGLQGVAIAERATQRARQYAMDRVQGRPVGGNAPGPIIRHADVRRMLLTMKASTEAARALAYAVSAEVDRARCHPDAAVRQTAQARVELLTPVVKAWSTDLGIEVANTGVQVHGGMGFVEETGAAQHLRDARIAAIYEGTNGIQALDLVGRKVIRDGGQAMAALLDDMRAVDVPLAAAGEDLAPMRAALAQGIACLAKATEWLLTADQTDPNNSGAAASPYLRLAGIVAGGWMMARAALAARQDLAAGDGDPQFLRAKLITARFYGEAILSQAAALQTTAMAGAATVMALPEEGF